MKNIKKSLHIIASTLCALSIAFTLPAQASGNAADGHTHDADIMPKKKMLPKKVVAPASANAPASAVAANVTKPAKNALKAPAAKPTTQKASAVIPQ